MWLKLTDNKGDKIVVNTDKIVYLYPHIDEEGNTYLEFSDDYANSCGLHVKESFDDICQFVNAHSVGERHLTGW